MCLLPLIKHRRTKLSVRAVGPLEDTRGDEHAKTCFPVQEIAPCDTSRNKPNIIAMMRCKKTAEGEREAHIHRHTPRLRGGLENKQGTPLSDHTRKKHVGRGENPPPKKSTRHCLTFNREWLSRNLFLFFILRFKQSIHSSSGQFRLLRSIGEADATTTKNRTRLVFV